MEQVEFLDRFCYNKDRKDDNDMAKTKAKAKVVDTSKMTPIHRKILSGIDAKDAARDSIPVGLHHFDFTVRFYGTMTVAEDELVIPTQQVINLSTMALAFRRMGIQRKAFIDTISQIANEAIEQGESVTDSVKAEVEDMEADIARLQAELGKKLTKVKRKGKCTKQMQHKVIKSEIRQEIVQNNSTTEPAADMEEEVVV